MSSDGSTGESEQAGEKGEVCAQEGKTSDICVEVGECVTSPRLCSNKPGPIKAKKTTRQVENLKSQTAVTARAVCLTRGNFIRRT